MKVKLEYLSKIEKTNTGGKEIKTVKVAKKHIIVKYIFTKMIYIIIEYRKKNEDK